MQVTDHMVGAAMLAYMKETAAEEFQVSGWLEPALRAALTAALSDKQAGEVKITPLEWKHDGNGSFAYCGVTDTRWVANNAEERAKADATRASRIRSALVDVPAVEPGPVFASRHNDETGECETVEVEPVKVRELREKIAASARRDYAAHLDRINRATDREIDEATRKRTSPPLSHRGEDSAEVIEALEAARDWIAILQGSTGNVVMPDGDERNPREIGDRANRLIRAALAATRSGPATTAKGVSE